MAVMISITGERNVEAILQINQSVHGITGRRVHAYPPVPIQCHETEGRVHYIVDHSQIQFLLLRYRTPVADSCSAERIDTHMDICVAYFLHIDHIVEVTDVSVEKVMLVRSGRAQLLLEMHSA